MLKACWDCFAGEGKRPEEAIVHLNGINTQAPAWPQPQLENENMFVIPKQLEVNDTIIINCTTSEDRNALRFGLITGIQSPDYSNTACQLEIRFQPETEDVLFVTLVQDGETKTLHTEPANQYYGTDSDFTVSFRLRRNNVISIQIGSSVLPNSFPLEHDMESIRFLSVNGDVSKVNSLDFKFG